MLGNDPRGEALANPSVEVTDSCPTMQLIVLNHIK